LNSTDGIFGTHNVLVVGGPDVRQDLVIDLAATAAQRAVQETSERHGE
jgi:hypothetical protein